MGKRMRRLSAAVRGVGSPVYTGNRGMGFEIAIEHSNRVYEHLGLALVNKRPTPMKIQSKTAGGRITGDLEKPSTVDFDGTLPGGRSIYFEAKQCKLPDRFPLDKLEQHQYDYLEKAHRFGSIGFLLIEFTVHRTVYLLPFKTLERYWHRWKAGGGVRGTASIHKDDMDVYAYIVESGRVPVDYIPVVRKVWGLEDAV